MDGPGRVGCPLGAGCWMRRSPVCSLPGDGSASYLQSAVAGGVPTTGAVCNRCEGTPLCAPTRRRLARSITRRKRLVLPSPTLGGGVGGGGGSGCRRDGLGALAGALGF